MSTSKHSPLNAEASSAPEPKRKPTSRNFRLAPRVPLVAAGTTAALAAAAVLLFTFGTFSDLSAMQLAAGPHSSARDASGQPLVLARTGRGWGGAARAGTSAPALAPVRLARTERSDRAEVSAATK